MIARRVIARLRRQPYVVVGQQVTPMGVRVGVRYLTDDSRTYWMLGAPLRRTEGGAGR